MSKMSKRFRSSARSEERYYKRLGLMPLVSYNYGGKYVADRAPWLWNLGKHGRCNTYFPCILVEYLRLTVSTVPENMSMDIARFLGMSPQLQREHVDGLRLARDYEAEDRDQSPTDFGEDEIPF